MEPTLHDGDIIVVRRSDGFWRKYYHTDTTEKAAERQQVNALEKLYCNPSGAISWFLQKPPLPLTGDIVVYKDPEYFSAKWNVKRVIGLGGQVVSENARGEKVFYLCYIDSIG